VPAQSFRDRVRYVSRALACLRPYARHVAGAYAAVFTSMGISVWMPIIIRGIVDDGIRGGNRGAITAGCVLLLVLAVVQGVATFVNGWLTETASQNVAFDLRNRFHEKLQSLSFSFHDQAETGQLLARSVADVDRIRFLTGRAFLNLVQMTAMTICIPVVMLVVEYRLGLLALCLVPLFLVGGLNLGRVLRPLSAKLRNQEAELTSFLEQNLRGARIVKAFGREAPQIAGFDERHRILLDLQRQDAAWRGIYMPLLHALAGVGTLVVLVVGGRLVIRGSLTPGELVAFLAYMAMLAGPCRRLGWIIAAIAEASASAERIFEVLDLRSDVSDAPDAVPLGPVRGHIRFDHVSFGYTKHRKVLTDIDIEILPGEKVAFLGGTGSGKSSVTNLIPRFYDPTAGAVLIDGIDIRTVTVRSLREHIGVVLQDTVLFASTIHENIAFGRPTAAAADVEAAARAAYAHDFIAALPMGYATRIGEKGVTLSGGQRQRLALARAILKDPEILILDDATSSVDVETEHLIQEALQRLMQGRTAIIIAQRLSTIRTADKVLVLDQGRVAAVGMRTATETPHDQLLRHSGVYADLYENQLRPAAPAPVGTGAVAGGPTRAVAPGEGV
jgi:ATP-binding cassette, subfamily B, multidrug efflux pump